MQRLLTLLLLGLLVGCGDAAPTAAFWVYVPTVGWAQYAEMRNLRTCEDSIAAVRVFDERMMRATRDTMVGAQAWYRGLYKCLPTGEKP